MPSELSIVRFKGGNEQARSTAKLGVDGLDYCNNCCICTRLDLIRSLCSVIHFIEASERSRMHKDGHVHSLLNVPLSIGG